MTDLTTAATRSDMAHAFAPPSFEMPKLDFPGRGMPAALHETAEKAVAQAKETCEKAKMAAEQATDLLKDIYATAAQGATDYNLKIIQFARTNTNTAFEYGQELLGVESPSELVALSTTHARKKFETMIAQTKELIELAQKVTTETTAPLKAGVTKVLSPSA
jgi:phasin